MLAQRDKVGCIGFISYFLILSVPLAIFGAVVAGYLHYMNMKIDIHTVVTIGVIFFIFLLFIPHNATYSSCKIRNQFEPMEKELKKDIRKTLLKIGNEKKSTLKIEDFFKSYFLDIRNDNFASVATTIFPMLGILGTFVSIAISMPDFSVSSTKDLDHEISVLLGGVGTAFYASIYGIFLSIWWLFWEKRGLSRIERSIKLVKNAYKKYLWDDVRLKHFLLAQNQMHNEELVESLKENFNIHFMKQFNDSYIESYQKLLFKTDDAFTKISRDMDRVSNKVGEVLRDVVSAKNTTDAIKEIDKRMADFNFAVEKLDNTVEGTLHSVDKEVGEIVKKLADFAAIVVQKSDEVERSIEKYHNKIEKYISKEG